MLHFCPSKSISSIWSDIYFPKPSFSFATFGFGCCVRSIIMFVFYALTITKQSVPPQRRLLPGRNPLHIICNNTPNTGHNISRNDRHKHPVLKKCMVEMLFPLWRGFASSSSMVTIESLHMTLWTDKNNKMAARTQDRFSLHHYFFHMNYGVDITRYK